MTQHVVLAAEASALVGQCLDAVVEQLRDGPAAVTVLGVAAKPRLACFAPLTGAVTPNQIALDSLAEASDAARELASRLPADVAVCHRVVDSWREVLRLAVEHDRLVVVGIPRRWRDRRAVAAWLARPTSRRGF